MQVRAIDQISHDAWELLVRDKKFNSLLQKVLAKRDPDGTTALRAYFLGRYYVPAIDSAINTFRQNIYTLEDGYPPGEIAKYVDSLIEARQKFAKYRSESTRREIQNGLKLTISFLVRPRGQGSPDIVRNAVLVLDKAVSAHHLYHPDKAAWAGFLYTKEKYAGIELERMSVHAHSLLAELIVRADEKSFIVGLKDVLKEFEVNASTYGMRTQNEMALALINFEMDVIKLVIRLNIDAIHRKLLERLSRGNEFPPQVVEMYSRIVVNSLRIYAGLPQIMEPVIGRPKSPVFFALKASEKLIEVLSGYFFAKAIHDYFPKDTSGSYSAVSISAYLSRKDVYLNMLANDLANSMYAAGISKLDYSLWERVWPNMYPDSLGDVFEAHKKCSLSAQAAWAMFRSI
jgi:hypothetical protein